MILPWDWWKLSFHWLFDLKGRRPPARRSSLFQNSLKAAVLGLSLGVAALSLTLAVVSGFQDVLGRSTSKVLGHLMWWTDWQKLDYFKEVPQWDPDISRLETFWYSQGLVVGPQGGRGIRIEGRREIFSKTPSAESAAPAAAQIDLGKPLAEFLGVKVGDRVRVLLPGLLDGAFFFEVRRLLEFGMYDLDSRLAFIDEKSFFHDLQARAPDALARRPGDALGLRVFYPDEILDPLHPQRLEKKKAAWVEKIQTAGLGKSAPLVQTWMEQKKNLFGAIGMDKAILTVVLSLLTLVAGLNIAAILVILYLERDREVATLQALGLSRWHLTQWLGVQGLILGLVSSGLGLLLARFLGFLLQRLPIVQVPAEIYNVSALPLRYEGQEQFGVFLFGMITATGVALFLGFFLSRGRQLTVMAHRR